MVLEENEMDLHTHYLFVKSMLVTNVKIVSVSITCLEHSDNILWPKREQNVPISLPIFHYRISLNPKPAYLPKLGVPDNYKIPTTFKSFTHSRGHTYTNIYFF